LNCVMQLHAARLCLDCEEVHDAKQCPVCASESYAAMTRWVPTAERRGRARPTTITEEAAVYQALAGDEARSSGGRRLLKHGALGLTAVGAIGWLLRSGKPVPKTGVASDTVEGAAPERVAGELTPPAAATPPR
jgi:hypothetical protein